MSRPLYLTVSTPLDSRESFFHINSIVGKEVISGDFHYKLELVSEDRASLPELIGQKLTVAFRYPGNDGNESISYINGIIVKICCHGNDVRNYLKRPWFYECEIASFLNPLSVTKDYRIFQESGQTAISIVTKLFQDFQYTKIKNETSRSYKEIPFCVQYGESATNFFNRLMEQEGISYFFDHDKNDHTLILRDGYEKAPLCPGLNNVRFRQNTDWDHYDTVNVFKEESQLTPSTLTINDYSFKTWPNISYQGRVNGGAGKLKRVEYPSGITNFSGTGKRMRELVHAEQASMSMFSGKSYIRSLRAGHRFKMLAPARKELHEKEYILHSIKLEATQRDFNNSFKAFPAIIPYYPQIRTEKPTIIGTQTAVVVGDGQVTDFDKDGSVRVHFHWDLYNQQEDSNSSCYVRCAFPAAGKNRGFQFPPHIGDEVVVTFENGDPDRPLIIGVVYGAGHAVPSTVRNKARRSTIKTATEKDSNQLMFEDQPGEESFNVIAKKDYTRRVQNQEIDHIQSNRQTFIQKGSPSPDESITDHLVVDGNRKVVVQKKDSLEEHINEGNFNHNISKNYEVTTQKNYQQLTEENQSHEVTKNFTLSVQGDTLLIEATGSDGIGDIVIRGKSVTLESTKDDVTIISAKNMNTEIAKAGQIKAGTDFIFKTGKATNINAGTKTIIKGSSGIALKGAKISLN